MDWEFDIDFPLEELFGDIDPVQVMLEDPDLKRLAENASNLSEELDQYITVHDTNACMFKEEPDPYYGDQDVFHDYNPSINYDTFESNVTNRLNQCVMTSDRNAHTNMFKEEPDTCQFVQDDYFSNNTVLEYDACGGSSPNSQESLSSCSTADSDQEVNPLPITDMTFSCESKQKNVPCMVCGKLSKSIHTFGAIVCLSCRAFFARSSKSDKYKLFVCTTGSQNCLIDSKSWMSCRWCRYNQCQKIGMSMTAKKEKKNTTTAIETTKNYNYILDYVTDGVKKLLLSPKAAITLSDVIDLGNLSDKHLEMANKNMCALIKSDLSIFKRFVNFFFKGIPFPLKDQKVVSDYMQYMGACSVKDEGLFPWDNLSMKDRMRLTTGNFSLMSEFIMIYRFCKFKDLHKDVILVKNSVCTNESEDYIQEIESIFNEASEYGHQFPKRGTYDMMFDKDQFPFTDRHKKTAIKVAQLGGYTPQESWDPIHGILTVFIIFYTPDFLDLDQPQEAEKIQTAYASLLHKYLRRDGDPKADAKFRESMMASSYVRELRDFRRQAYSKLRLI